jgi:signal transduction histidine kinase
MAVKHVSLTPIKVYLGCLVGMCALLLVLSLVTVVSHDALSDHLAWFVGSILLTAFATAWVIELRQHLRLSVRAAPQLMAALLLGPALALIAVAVGVVAGYTYHLSRGRHNLTDLLFNAAQGMLSTGIAAVVYLIVQHAPLGYLAEPLALVMAAESMHLSNTLLVAGAIALSDHDAGVASTFLHLMRRDDPLQYAALLVTGIVGALLARQEAFWAVPLLGIPLALVQHSLIKQREEAERERKLAVMEEVNALKNDFIAAVTHDLRTPLMVIKGFGELLSEREDELMADERRAIEAINLNAERLAELIEMLLQLSELDAGMVILKRTPSDVPALIERVLKEVRYLAEQKQVTVTMHVLSPVPLFELDPKRFEQVMTNLLCNAIRFTPAGGKIAASVGFSDESLTVSVRDSGRGMAPEVLPHIFERFYRAPGSGDRRRIGGLGLAIVKSIVELHGGTITAASRLGEESTFTICLPRPQPVDDHNADLNNARDQALTEVLQPVRPLPNTR